MYKILVIIIFLVSLTGSVGETYASIVPIKMNELVKRSDYIVLGRCKTITTVEGARIAKVEVFKTIKGKEASELYYLAEGTMMCDISGAIIDETALYFLTVYKFSVVSNSKEVLPKGKDSSQEPSTFRRTIESLTANGQVPFLQIAHYGRGRMPFRVVDGLDYVTLWTDVILPDYIETISGPEKQYSDFIRSVQLDKLLLLVDKELIGLKANTGNDRTNVAADSGSSLRNAPRR